MNVITTEFDSDLEEDIVFEETDSTESVKQTLKNSENILKGFLYLQKLTDSKNPYVNRVVKMDTIETSEDKQLYSQNQETGLILIKNTLSVGNSSIYYNGGQFILFPFDYIEFPIDITDEIRLTGSLTIIESEYKLGKD